MSFSVCFGCDCCDSTEPLSVVECAVEGITGSFEFHLCAACAEAARRDEGLEVDGTERRYRAIRGAIALERLIRRAES